MQPRGLLMVEHRLIERMIALIGKEARRIDQSRKADVSFISRAVDFMTTYADRAHHGKEEGILFRELALKELSGQDRRIMEDLIRDHELFRRNTDELTAAAERYRLGSEAALTTLVEKLSLISSAYLPHITKEDKVFFPAAMEYLSPSQQQAMLEEFAQFDRRLIHEVYDSMVERLEQ